MSQKINYLTNTFVCNLHLRILWKWRHSDLFCCSSTATTE